MTDERVDDHISERRDMDLFMLSAPSSSSRNDKGAEATGTADADADGREQRSHLPGGRNRRPQTWWTVDARAPEPEREVDKGSARAVALLLGLLDLHRASTWEVVQL